MADEEKSKRLEIGHVLFIDIVGYSKLLGDDQAEALHELNHLVRETNAFREAEAADKLVPLPTGDGMALVFTNSVEAPAECALELSQALRRKPSLPVRMGIHSGPVHQVEDVNERNNIAGAGINIAQRVMDCGDAGHILVSKRVADDLAQSRRWQPYLHDLGDMEVKHGVILSLVNLYADVIGNPQPPAKFHPGKSAAKPRVKQSYSPVVYIIPIVAMIIPAVIFAPAVIRSIDKSRATPAPQPTASATPSLGDTIKQMVTKRVMDDLQKELPANLRPHASPAPPSPPTLSATPEPSITPDR